ncbi:MAG: glycosyl transferase, partial [Paracoccaceae bacterium]|nr:glycosyl transferase [Paracoccaceae bacterium]
CHADLTPIAPSPVWHRPFGFANALVQNVAAGNTIVLNRAALDLAQAASFAADAAGIVAHDWWLYQLVTGVGGQVIRDPEPVLLYRQHAGNQMGRNDTVAAAIWRLRRILRGEFRDWNARNIAALRPLADRLTPENQALLAGFATLRWQAAAGRLCGLARLGLYRQTRRAGLAMWLAAGLNRL